MLIVIAAEIPTNYDQENKTSVETSAKTVRQVFPNVLREQSYIIEKGFFSAWLAISCSSSFIFCSHRSNSIKNIVREEVLKW